MRDKGARLAELLEESLSIHPFPVHESTQISVALSVLDGLQLIDDVVRPIPEAIVAGGGPCQTDTGKIMSGDMSGQLPAIPIPAAVAFRFRLQFGAAAQIRQHSIGCQGEQVFEFEILRVFEWAPGQSDIL